MPSLIRRIQEFFSSPPPGPPHAKPTDPPPPPAPPKLPIPPELLKAAADFKQLFISKDAVYHLEGGQGALTQEMTRLLVKKIRDMKPDPVKDLLKAELVDLLQGNANREMRKAYFDHSPVRLGQKTIEKLQKEDPGHPDASKIAGVLRSGSIVNTEKTYVNHTAKARELIARLPAADSDRQLAIDVLDDKSANGNWSYNTLNDWMNRPTLAPVTFDKMSLPRVLALTINSSVQCAPIAAATARKLYKTRGIAAADAPGFTPRTFAAEVSKGAKKLRPGDEDTSPGPSTKQNVILRYSPANLDPAMQQARVLLANGDPTHDAKSGYLRCGCLSGIKWEIDDHPMPEHTILIFAALNDTVLFWDPNAAATNIREYGTESGNPLGITIGLMFYDTSNPARPRLTTGVDLADLMAVDGGGDHTRHTRRHRYQVAELAKV